MAFCLGGSLHGQPCFLHCAPQGVCALLCFAPKLDINHLPTHPLRLLHILSPPAGAIKVTVIQAWRPNRRQSANYLDVNVALLAPLKPRVTGLLAPSYSRALNAA